MTNNHFLTWIATILCLLFIFFAKAEGGEYNRKDYRHWVDEDKDGFNTRQEVLIEENLADTLYIIRVKNKLKIVRGLWVCPYTGDSITNPKELDVDHLIPLKHAHENGGSRWKKKEKEEFANHLKDKDHLVAVKASANRQKGAKHPGQWMPDINKKWYLETWFRLKRKWKLDFELNEIPRND